MPDDLKERAKRYSSDNFGVSSPVGAGLIAELVARIESLESRIGELEEALTWYAGFDAFYYYGFDVGHRARQALHPKDEG